ncbi:hypothetical protein [Chryseobacterium sp. 2R14A]|uniref:hypothetical protein n=1 Tax=Chryseobacterium sp. 2R14A TaxID=3380353 RepID=UPI003CED9818
MKVLFKALGLFLFVFSFAFYQAAPIQKRHHGPNKSYYHGNRGPHKMKYKKVVYYKAPKHYYKKHYYKPQRTYKYYSYKRYKQPRVYHSRPVIVVNL